MANCRGFFIAFAAGLETQIINAIHPNIIIKNNSGTYNLSFQNANVDFGMIVTPTGATMVKLSNANKQSAGTNQRWNFYWFTPYGLSASEFDKVFDYLRGRVLAGDNQNAQGEKYVLGPWTLTTARALPESAVKRNLFNQASDTPAPRYLPPHCIFGFESVMTDEPDSDQVDSEDTTID